MPTLNNSILFCHWQLQTGSESIITIIIIIIIWLYFIPQWVHRKDNAKYAKHVNITQICLKHVGLSQCCEVIQGCNPYAVQFRRDMYITVNYYTMCNQIKGQSIDIRGCKHGTCTAPHRQTTQDTKRIIIYVYVYVYVYV